MNAQLKLIWNSNREFDISNDEIKYTGEVNQSDVNPYSSAQEQGASQNNKTPKSFLDEFTPRQRSGLNFIACLAAPILGLIVGLVLGIVLMIPYMMASGPPAAGTSEAAANTTENLLSGMTASPVGLAILLLPGQLGFLAVAAALALFSSRGWIGRLELYSGRLPKYSWLFFVLATPCMALIINFILAPLLPESDAFRLIEQIIDQYQGVSLLGVIFLIAVAPGICEEFMFRGYCQTKLSSLAGPAVAILVSSFLFAVVHLDFTQSTLVFFLGIWFGVVSWRCRSIWPAVLCHFFNNAFSVVLAATGTEETSPIVMAIFLVSAIFALVAIWLLFVPSKIAIDPSGKRLPAQA